jgi:O-antigen/teichoic acid export membrane protein
MSTREELIDHGTQAGEPAMSGAEVRERAAAGVVVVSLRGIALRVLALGGNIVLARLLVPRDFGVVALGATVMWFGAMVAEAGVGAALIRRPEEPRAADFQTVMAFQLIVTTTLAVAAALIASPFGTTGGVIAIMAVSLPIMAFRTPGLIKLERQLSYRPLMVVEVVETTAYYGWAITSVALGAGVWGLASGAIARAVVGSVIMVTVSGTGVVRPRMHWDRLKRLLGFGLRYQAVGVVDFGRSQGLNVGIAALGSLSTLGLWTLGLRVLQVPGLLLESLWRVSFPAMSKLVAGGENLRPLMERSTRLVAIVAGLMLVALVGSSPALVPSVFGSQWTQATDVIPWAALGVMIGGPVSVATSAYLFAVGAAGPVLRAHLAGGVVTLGVTFALLPSLGLTAVGLGYLAGSAVDAVLLALPARRRSGARVGLVIVVPAILAAVGASAGWLLASSGDATLLLAFFSMSVATLIYLAALALVRRSALGDAISLTRRALGSLLAGNG